MICFKNMCLNKFDELENKRHCNYNICQINVLDVYKISLLKGKERVVGLISASSSDMSRMDLAIKRKYLDLASKFYEIGEVDIDEQTEAKIK